MKTIITTTAVILVMATTATASPKSCSVKTDTNGVQIIKKGCDAFVGGTGAQGPQGERGLQGEQGLSGNGGQDGSRGSTGDKGDAGKDAVAPLGALSFAAASASFYGYGMGLGLSNSNYGNLEGSIVFGFDLNNNWRVVSGVTTDFNERTAGSVGVGVSF
tara:strand:- start:588 stop:1067 length:480 start_codon:yes stop_codon:yes gene_type:complete